MTINIIVKGLDNITDGDIQRAETAQATVLGFHVKPTAEAQQYAKEKGVEIRLYEVIYKLLEDVKARLEAMLKPEIIRTELGKLKVLAVFRQEKKSMIIGGKVTKGKVALGAKVEVFHNDQMLTAGSITGLQVNKIKVDQAENGQECGLNYEGKPLVSVGDSLVVYQEEVKERRVYSYLASA